MDAGKQSRAATAPATRALVVCAHLRPGRDKRHSRYFMQPIAGLHVASLIDPGHFDVRLYHEDWHGPFDPSQCAGYDLVFLSGLQPDFDRMRQLSYYFRRSGATVVAGGSICTSFPEFATRFFDVVCAGGVDSVRGGRRRLLRGSLQADLPLAGRPHLALRGRPRPAREERHQSAASISGEPPAAAASSAASASSRPRSATMRAMISRRSAAAIDNAHRLRARSLSFRRWYPMIILPRQQFLRRPRAHARGRGDAGSASPGARLERPRHAERRCTTAS